MESYSFNENILRIILFLLDISSDKMIGSCRQAMQDSQY